MRVSGNFFNSEFNNLSFSIWMKHFIPRILRIFNLHQKLNRAICIDMYDRFLELSSLVSIQYCLISLIYALTVNCFHQHIVCCQWWFSSFREILTPCHRKLTKVSHKNLARKLLPVGSPF